MAKILLVAPNGKELATYLTEQMDAQIEMFDDVYELHERVRNSPLRATMLILRDGAFRHNKLKIINLKEAGTNLIQILTDNMFEVNRVIHLNDVRNTQYLETMKFIEGSEKVVTPINIVTRETFTASSIKNIITKSNLTYDLPEKRYKHVIRRKRNEDDALKSKKLQGETDRSVILEYPTINTQIEQDRNDLRNNLKDYTIKANDSEYDIIEEIDVDIKQDTYTQVETTTNIIGIMGLPKTGTTTMTMILGSSASLTHKTLIVDMNYDNMGLSYLAENAIADEDIKQISFSDMITNGNAVEYLTEQSFDIRKLHILSMDLPSKRLMDKEDFSFFVSNILTHLKKSYEYILLDIPLNDIQKHKDITSKLDMIILTTTPYITDIQPTIKKMSETMEDLAIFNLMNNTELTKIKCIRTNTFSVVPESIYPVTKETIDNYAKDIIGRTFPVTGVYEYSGTTFIDTVLFQQIITNTLKYNMI